FWPLLGRSRAVSGGVPSPSSLVLPPSVGHSHLHSFLHDALPIYGVGCSSSAPSWHATHVSTTSPGGTWAWSPSPPNAASISTGSDRKSTRLNSSHVKISYAVFCLKKKKRGRRAASRRHAPSRGSS